MKLTARASDNDLKVHDYRPFSPLWPRLRCGRYRHEKYASFCLLDMQADIGARTPCRAILLQW